MTDETETDLSGREFISRTFTPAAHVDAAEVRAAVRQAHVDAAINHLASLDGMTRLAETIERDQILALDCLDSDDGFPGPSRAVLVLASRHERTDLGDGRITGLAVGAFLDLLETATVLNDERDRLNALLVDANAEITRLGQLRDGLLDLNAANDHPVEADPDGWSMSGPQLPVTTPGDLGGSAWPASPAWSGRCDACGFLTYDHDHPDTLALHCRNEFGQCPGRDPSGNVLGTVTRHARLTTQGETPPRLEADESWSDTVTGGPQSRTVSQWWADRVHRRVHGA